MFMSSKVPQLIPSDLALAVFYDAGNWENAFVLFRSPLQITHVCNIKLFHMQSATRQVHLDLLMYGKLLTPWGSNHSSTNITD